MSFSERMGFVPERQIQINSIDDSLRNRLYNYFDSFKNSSIIEYIADRMGFPLGSYSTNYSNLQRLFLPNEKWFLPYDVLEYLIYYLKNINHFNPKDLREVYYPLNQILVEEKSGYRMVDGKFVPITDEEELKEIQNAMDSEFDAVDQHIKKALMLYSDRHNPDYDNSIKESISAVESMCCIITGMSGANATLGATLKKLEENGVKIHSAMNSAFSKLYGYTSDQDGIRHGGIDFENAPEEDARYMLVSCSAFVNYLKDKYSKVQNGT